jgi:peptide/nickel transport system substrate-binding protein
MGNFDIADFAWVSGTPYPLSGSQDTYRRDGGQNFGRFADPALDALLRQGLGEPDPARAAAIGNQIDQQLWRQLPSIPLYQLQSVLAWREQLLNVASNPTTEGHSGTREPWRSPSHRARGVLAHI